MLDDRMRVFSCRRTPGQFSRRYREAADERTRPKTLADYTLEKPASALAALQQHESNARARNVHVDSFVGQ